MSQETHIKTLRRLHKRLSNVNLGIYTPTQKLEHRQLIKDIEEITEVIKQVNYYGGINTLIDQAKKTALAVDLFAEITPELTKS